MASKLLLIGDPHLKLNKKKMHVSRLELITSNIVKIIIEKQVDICVIMGDTLHDHGNLSMSVLALVVKWFEDISRVCKLVVLIGNHDREDNRVFLTGIHPFVGLHTNDNITIVSDTVWDRMNDFIYVPYVPPGRFNEALAKVGYTPGDNPSPRLIFAHQEFKGCKVGLMESKHGDTWSDAFPTVYSGHIHEYQTLPGVVYVGTFQQTRYGESADKALYYIDTTQGTHERIMVPDVQLLRTIDCVPDELPDLVYKDYSNPDVRTRISVNVPPEMSSSIKTNPHYLALKQKGVDMHVRTVASGSQQVLRRLNDKGLINASRVTLSSMVVALLKEQNKLSALEVFQTEIAG